MKVYQALLNSIKRGVISPVYLLYGSEQYLMHKAVIELRSYLTGGEMGEFNLSVLDAEKVRVEEVVEAANTLPFFSDKRLVIVENAPYFKNKRKKGEGEEVKEVDDSSLALLNYLQSPNPTTCLVFLTLDKINKSKKLYKAVEKAGQALEFAPLTSQELQEWVKARFSKLGKKIEPSALQYMLAINSNDLGILHGEIEKLSLLDEDRESITLNDVKQAASASVEASIFDLVDSIGEKRTAQAIQILRDMLGQGEPPLKVLAMISRQSRLILAAKSIGSSGYAQNQIAGALSVHPYVGQKLLKQARNFSMAQLQDALEICLELDLAFKSGKGSPSLLLELAIICISTGQPLELMA